MNRYSTQEPKKMDKFLKFVLLGLAILCLLPLVALIML